jgi:hypothetical protein
MDKQGKIPILQAELLTPFDGSNLLDKLLNLNWLLQPFRL